MYLTVHKTMTSQDWQQNEPGILRKKEEEHELLVFGYSCKLFRDDEKALFIDQGKHLIPWMGNNALKIDRYDGRGALFDLHMFEAQSDSSSWLALSDSERHIEQLCDEERYRALSHNEEEEALYQEEELKRLHKALGKNSYGQVAFSYDEPPESQEEKKDDDSVDSSDELDEPFTAPPELDIPINMAVPETVKLNAIIEKTALFICQQGPQMEILLKMKQDKNPQFKFLSFDSTLHPYYRHLLMAMKTGRYKPQNQDKKNESVDSETEDHYLHPSLAANHSRVESAPSIPSINYKPSADCAYSMLVNNIKNKQAAFISKLETDSLSPDISLDSQIYDATENVIEGGPVLYHTSSTLANLDGHPLSTDNITAPHNDDNKGHTASGTESPSFSRNMFDFKELGFNQQEDKPQITIPPSDLQLIIDKMASYVSKNGRDFETIVKSKGDSRFLFLEPNNPHHSYYQMKVAEYKELDEPENVDKDKISDNDSQDKDVNGESPNMRVKVPTKTSSKISNNVRQKPLPVCFSIKKPKEELIPVDKRIALTLEESTDDENEEDDKGTDKDKVKVKDKGGDQVKDENMNKDKPKRHAAPPEKEKTPPDKAKWAEERVKDKLISAAREKVAAAAKEKQLQLERKKRAAAFLNKIQNDPTAAILPKKPTFIEINVSDEVESLVVSPDTSTGTVSPLVTNIIRPSLADRLNPTITADNILDHRHKHSSGHIKKSSHHHNNAHGSSTKHKLKSKKKDKDQEKSLMAPKRENPHFQLEPRSRHHKHKPDDDEKDEHSKKRHRSRSSSHMRHQHEALHSRREKAEPHVHHKKKSRHKKSKKRPKSVSSSSEDI
ncbi:unnamed protein product [Timema podura]|uniref:SURP motif domain-containing protein n=1 Tax=Timema podura TaxID=61482 RepID=A0ABN7NVD3_TIMPD|nr:unnamed protein product [Timema podura]